MAKLCPKGKAAAKRKFKVYPSAYANMYASGVCSGKITPGGKKNRKKAMGGGMMTDRPMYGLENQQESNLIDAKCVLICDALTYRAWLMIVSSFALCVVTIVTNSSFWEAGMVALIEPCVNGVWFYILHRVWRSWNG